MVSGAADHWSDAQLVPFAVLLAVGAVIGPIVLRPQSERALPIWQTAGFKLSLAVVGFSLLMNYTQTPYFFDVLHMHFNFRTRMNIRDNPIALYFLTVPYFATYCVLCLAAYRRTRHALRRHPRLGRLAGGAVAPFVVAFLETVLNANPFARRVFCYDDMKLMLWFGTFSYGTAFCFALPVWLYIDERPGVRVSLLSVVVGVAAAVYGDSLALDFYRYRLAPHVTTVVEGARGLGYRADSCLSAPLDP
jgi:hypothetical protein